MNDNAIIELYFQRDERAIDETRNKYGSFCYRIAQRILSSRQDSEEVVNDTYLGAWEAIPPQRPRIFSAFLAKITRSLSMKKLRYNTAQKRSGDTVALALDELSECIPAQSSVAESYEAKEVGEMIDSFLQRQKADDRRIFVCRYFYLESVEQIAQECRCSQSRVYASLDRVRGRLKDYLREEGVV